MFPLTWSPLLNSQSSSGDSDVVDWSCSVAAPSCLESWGRPSGAPGLALGCEDGTFYLFHQAVPRTQPLGRRGSTVSSGPPPRLSNSSRPTSPRRYGGLGFSNSRAGSPSSPRSPLSPFQVSKMRAVSSVTTEQAEAPKNYVDFDEEAEKMKGMLKGKGVKEKGPSPTYNRSSSRERDGETPSPKVQALSPTSSTKSLPTLSVSVTPPPLSELPDGPDALSLTCHVFPPKYGYLHAVRAFKLYDSGRYLICLQEAG